MDLQTLAQQIVSFLTPFLPYLLKVGEKAAEEAGKKLGADAWERAKALWAKLRPKVEGKPAAQEAAADVAANPQDEDAQAALRHQLKKLLAEDESLLADVTPIMSKVKVETVKKGGKVTGVWITTPKGRVFIRSEVEAGDVYGHVTGVRYEG